MAIEYTPNQLKVIEDRNNNIIVSAQAGAGKTQILVKRIINLIIEGTSINEMLIVTFTNKAANEMKDRIKQGISDAMKDSSNNLRYLSRELNEIEDADISTMHAFCIKIIREYFNELNIDPNFNLLNEQTLEILKKDSIDEIFDNSYDIYEFREFLNKYGSFRGHDNAKEMILDIARFLESQISIDWLTDNVNFAQTDERKSLIYNYFLDKYKETIINVKEEINSLLSILTNDGPESYIDGILNDLSQIDELINYIDKGDGEKFYLKTKTFGDARLSSKKVKNEREAENKEHVKLVRDRYKGVIRNIEALTFSDLDEEAKIFKTLEYLTKSYINLFNEKKREKNGIDFSDAEHLMLKLLEDEKIRKEIRERYVYIFFDEYQDANNIQNTIIDRIKREDNLFFVGDLKQSIYSFRLADPSIFLDRYNSYKEEEKSLSVDLTDNFRSRKEVLNFVNFIFDNLMTKEFGQIDYKSKENRLNPGNLDFNDNKKAVELILMRQHSYKKRDPRIDEIKREYDNLDPEVILVGERILKEVKEGAKFSDFCILTRTKNVISDYEKYFKAIDIPLYSESNDITFKKEEILTFINILKTIDNEKNDKALIASLISPMGGFTNEEIAKIRIENKEGPFYYACMNYPKEDEIKEKLDYFIVKLKNFREELPYMPLEDFGYFVLDDSGLREFISSMEDGKLKMNNLYSFLDIMGNYEEGSNGSLYGFLRYVNDLIKINQSDLTSMSSNIEKDNVVKIMTIHKAKGLQFNRVFLVDLDHKFNERDLREDIIFDDKYGMGMRVSYPEYSVKRKSPSFMLISEILLKKNREEEARVLYVALTRAIDKLYLVGKISSTHKDKALSDPNLIYLDEDNSYMKWIYKILYNNIVSVNLLEDDNNRPYRGYSKILNAVSYIFDDIDVYLKMKKIKSEGKIEVSYNLDKKYQDILEFKYPYKNLIEMPFKKTVSEISGKNNNLENTFKPWDRIDTIFKEDIDISDRKTPNFIRDRKIFKSNEIGSILHFVLQNISLRNHDINSIKKELDHMVEIYLLTKEEREVVDESLILKFFTSDLGKDIVKNKDSVVREDSFTMEYDGYLVDGQIDLFYFNEDGLNLVDFKSNKSMNIEIYKKQIGLYKIALEKAKGIKVNKSYIYWIRFGKISEMDI